MKIIVVVGSGSGCGKTTAVCDILRAIPGLGAVKISPREGPQRVEWGAGAAGKDTDLYARSGAAHVARIVGPRDRVAQAWQQISGEFAGCRGVVVEGTRGLDIPGERLVVFAGGERWRESRPVKNLDLARSADIVLEGLPGGGCDELPELVRRFLSRAAGAGAPVA